MKTPILITLLLMTGCATSSIKLAEHDASSAAGGWNGTAILLDYSFETSDHAILKEGCSLILRNKTDSKDYAIPLAGAGHSILFDAPAGTYVGKQLSCPEYTKWEIESFVRTEGFAIEVGKINYLGKISFQFAPDGKAMKLLEGDQRAVTESLSSDMSKLPARWLEALHDPFTRKPLNRSMLGGNTNHVLDIHTKHYLKAGETPSPTKDLETALRECDRAELKRFPYRVGTLMEIAIYQNRKLKDLNKDDHDSFSTEFESCLDQSFRSFQPATNSKLEVKASL